MKRTNNLKRTAMLGITALVVSIGMSSCKSHGGGPCPAYGSKKHYKKRSYASTNVIISTDENV